MMATKGSAPKLGEPRQGEPGAVGAAASPSTDGSQVSKRCPKCERYFPVAFKVCPQDATALEEADADADPLLGQVLSDTYQLSRLIGEGGMGAVYEARHTRLKNKRYAVKLVHAELGRNSEVSARFEREAEAASALSHPNVVSVIDVNRSASGQPYLVQELLVGEPLAAFLDRVRVVPTREAVRLVRQIISALGAAHAAGIVHRDMKPENVFLEGEDPPTVKVLDFGISKLTAQDSSLTKTGMVMGTPDYMPPEQAKGARVDYLADVYSVGAILYRALTGRTPFEETDSMATLSAVILQEPPRPRTLVSTIPASLELVVQQAMAKEPSERYQSMAAFDAALAPFDQDSGVSVKHPDGSDSQRFSWLAGVVEVAKTQSLAVGAERARPLIVAETGLATLWLLAGLTSVTLSAVYWATGRARLSNVELWLSGLGAVLLLLTPAILWARYLGRRVWGNTPRAMALSERLGAALVVSTASYGVGSIGVYLYEALYQGAPRDVAWPGYPILLFGVSVLSGALSWQHRRPKRARGV